jgi:hypothetical protein
MADPGSLHLLKKTAPHTGHVYPGTLVEQQMEPSVAHWYVPAGGRSEHTPAVLLVLEHTPASMTAIQCCASSSQGTGHVSRWPLPLKVVQPAASRCPEAMYVAHLLFVPELGL